LEGQRRRLLRPRDDKPQDGPVMGGATVKRRQRFRAVVLILASGYALTLGGWASAAVPKPAVKGTIIGQATQSSRLTIRVEASEAGGFQSLKQVQVFLLLHGVILDDIAYDQDGGTIGSTSSFPIPVGNPHTFVSRFFRLSGRDVSVAGSGDALTVVFRPVLALPVPQGAVFSLGVIDDVNQVQRITRGVQLPEPQRGFSWGTLLAAVIAALFAGSFLGGLLSSRRRPPMRPSVYRAVRRRIAEKASP
jgi:hypothetical protein